MENDLFNLLLKLRQVKPVFQTYEMGTSEGSGGGPVSNMKRGSQSNAKLFANVRTVGRLDIVRDDRGYEVVVEAREDSEQTQKYLEIIDLLVAAGYFRARIQVSNDIVYISRKVVFFRRRVMSSQLKN